jgi:hypothetical protein
VSRGPGTRRRPACRAGSEPGWGSAPATKAGYSAPPPPPTPTRIQPPPRPGEGSRAARTRAYSGRRRRHRASRRCRAHSTRTPTLPQQSRGTFTQRVGETWSYTHSEPQHLPPTGGPSGPSSDAAARCVTRARRSGRVRVARAGGGGDLEVELGHVRLDGHALQARQALPRARSRLVPRLTQTGQAASRLR